MALAAFPATSQGAFYYVEGSNPSATDSGPGTEATPYRTIAAAVTQRGGPGTTVLVKPGTYREQVTVGASGASGSPFVIQALGGPVEVDGSDDFSAPSLWTQASGTVWLASSVSWAPFQVFVDGARLVASVDPPASLQPGTFRYVTGSGLYVNVGGDNPGLHETLVGRRLYGFRLSGRSWVTIAGFSVAHTENKGIYLSSASDHTTLAENVVRFANSQGIAVTSCADVRIERNVVSESADHGIYLSSVTGSTLRRNESFKNARPAVRAANGINLTGSSGNRVEENRLHHNQDTGLQIGASSNTNVFVQNLSWSNGDHGVDHLSSAGNAHVGDVAWGNYKDGFSFEGNSPDGRLHNCVAVDNGLETNEFDLWVDSGSATGFVSDYNLFWNSNGQAPVKFISTPYSSVAAYAAASGHDTHSTQANPRLTAPAAGDFHPLAGSPLIDAANSSVANWPANDAEGQLRFDDPSTANTGVGPMPFADRGALEFRTTTGNSPPVAELTVTPSSGTAPLQVTADASGSRDPDGSIVSYRFDFGDGGVAGPQPGPSASHRYEAGIWTATVTVTDGTGLTGVASQTVTVTSGVDRPPLVIAPTTFAGTENATLTVIVTASDPDGQAITSLTADRSLLPAGNNATFTAGAGNVSGTLSWTPSFTDAGSYQVTFRASNSAVGTATTTLTVVNVDRPPVVVAPVTVRGTAGQLVVVDVTASDPDGDPITALTADLSKLPAGNDAVFVPAADNRSGRLQWTPSPSTKGNFKVTFTARNVLAAAATSTLRISRHAPPAGVQPVLLPSVIALSHATPNPSSAGVAFVLDLPRPARVDWSIHDLQGRMISNENADREAGQFVIRWSGLGGARGRLGAGVYTLQVRVDGVRFVRRFVRL